MRIGFSFDLKENIGAVPGSPDDFLEEYDSLDTVGLISDSLVALGHEVVPLGGGVAFLHKIQDQAGLDIVFNIAEGRGNYPSREAQVPSVLEMLGVPYTGSSPLCLAVCLDKALTKTVLKASGITTPGWHIARSQEELKDLPWDAFRFPLVVKPACEGSSKGIHDSSLVSTVAEARTAAERILAGYRQPVILENYITGEEITVGIVGNSAARVLGIMRIVPRNKNSHFVYSIEVKRDYLNLVDYECPAQLNRQAMQRIEQDSLKIYSVLGCRDMARLDFKVSADGTPYFLEINPLPGLGNHSDLVIMARLMGLSHRELMAIILEAAVERYPQCAAV